MIGRIFRSWSLFILVLYPSVYAGPLAVPPAPSPLPALGISIRDSLDSVGLRGYDPIVIARKGQSQCPSGYREVESSELQGAVNNTVNQSGGSANSGSANSTPNIDSATLNSGIGTFTTNLSRIGSSICVPANNPPTYLDQLLGWFGTVAGTVLAQFTGDAVARFAFGDKKELRLSELLDGLCVAWNEDRTVIEKLQEAGYLNDGNLLGETICSLSNTYTSILEAIRTAYLYGDSTINTYIGRVISQFVVALIQEPINNIKAEIIKGYNSLPFARPIRNVARALQGFVSQATAELKDMVYYSRQRSNPYVDSTVAWLLSLGVQAMEEINNAQSQTGGNGGSTEPSPAPPEKVAMVMAATSPRTLQQLQAIGEQQERLRVEAQNQYAELKQRGERGKKEALKQADKVSGGEVNPEVGQDIAGKAKGQSSERDLLISLIDLNYTMAKAEITQSKRLEALLAHLVEQNAMNTELLAQEAREEIEGQIQALEELKKQVMEVTQSYAEEMARTTAVLDGTQALIGALGIERAGMILTEEEFNALANSRTLNVP